MKMIRNADSKYDHYSISPKIRQILLHWDLWVNKKRFWAVKLIYNNERLNSSIKYDRRVLQIKYKK